MLSDNDYTLKIKFVVWIQWCYQSALQDTRKTQNYILNTICLKSNDYVIFTKKRMEEKTVGHTQKIYINLIL